METFIEKNSMPIDDLRSDLEMFNLKEIAQERELQYKDFDERFRNTSPQDTDSFIGLMKNQPALAINAWNKALVESPTGLDFANILLRSAELVSRNTSEYWKIQTNFFNDVLAANMCTSDLTFTSSKTFDFMIRTKAFCYANQFSFPIRRPSSGYTKTDVSDRFFSSIFLPESLRFDFKAKKEVPEILDFLNQFKKHFDLSTREYSALMGTIMGKSFSRNSVTASNIVRSDILKTIMSDPGIDKFIYDLTFGSTISSNMLFLSPVSGIPDTERAQFTYSCLQYFASTSEHRFLASALALNKKIPNEVKEQSEDLVKTARLKSEHVKMELAYHQKSLEEDLKKAKQPDSQSEPFKVLDYSFGKMRLEELLSEKILKSEDPVQEFISLYKPDEEGKISLFHPDDFEKFFKYIAKDKEEIVNCYGIYYATYPYLIGLHAPVDFTSLNISNKDVIQKYLEYGGDIDKLPSFEKY